MRLILLLISHVIPEPSVDLVADETAIDEFAVALENFPAQRSKVVVSHHDQNPCIDDFHRAGDPNRRFVICRDRAQTDRQRSAGVFAYRRHDDVQWIEHPVSIACFEAGE